MSAWLESLIYAMMSTIVIVAVLVFTIIGFIYIGSLTVIPIVFFVLWFHFYGLAKGWDKK